jgi:hypothetical protein
MPKRPISFPKLRKVPTPCSGVEQRLVRERSSAQLSPEACTLSLFLGTVADAQGLRCSSEQSRCQRVSMTPTGGRQARQAVFTQIWEVLA